MKCNYLKISVITCLLAFVVILSGCFNSNDGVPYYQISDEFAEYCWFEDGSWWCYQNDSTLIKDTVLVVDVNVDKRFSTENEDFNYQAVELYTTSSVMDIVAYELTAGDYTAEEGEMNSLLRVYFADGSYQHVFTPQYTIGEGIDLGDDIGVYTNISDSETLTINGVTYNEVWQTRRVVSVSFDGVYNYWIAKNYGIVKFTYEIDGQTYSYSLVSSGLIQE